MIKFTHNQQKEGKMMKKLGSVCFVLVITFLLAGCSSKVTVKDLKAHDWQLDIKKNDESINYLATFSDEVMTLSFDTSDMKSESSNEWEKMGEDFGKQLLENMKFKVQYSLKGNSIHLKNKDLDLDNDYTIKKDNKNLVLTPEKKGEQLILKPYKKTKSSSKTTDTTTTTTKTSSSTSSSSSKSSSTENANQQSIDEQNASLESFLSEQQASQEAEASREYAEAKASIDADNASWEAESRRREAEQQASVDAENARYAAEEEAERLRIQAEVDAQNASIDAENARQAE